MRSGLYARIDTPSTRVLRGAHGGFLLAGQGPKVKFDSEKAKYKNLRVMGHCERRSSLVCALRHVTFV